MLGSTGGSGMAPAFFVVLGKDTSDQDYSSAIYKLSEVDLL